MNCLPMIMRSYLELCQYGHEDFTRSCQRKKINHDNLKRSRTAQLCHYYLCPGFTWDRGNVPKKLTELTQTANPMGYSTPRDDTLSV